MAEDTGLSQEDIDFMDFCSRYTDEQIDSGEAEFLEELRRKTTTQPEPSPRVQTKTSLLPPTLSASASASPAPHPAASSSSSSARSSYQEWAEPSKDGVLSRPAESRVGSNKSSGFLKRPAPDARSFSPDDSRGVDKIAAAGSGHDQQPGEDSVEKAFAAVMEEVDVSLDAHQHEIINAAMSGKNVFITGQAGTGKSRVLKYMINQMRLFGKVVHQVAHNGAAATNINGVTIHWFFGINGSSKPPYEVKSQEARERIEGADVLIVDEISTVDNHMLSGLDLLCRQIRKRMDVPFGGIQIIACGDFAQLKPIDDSKRKAKQYKDAQQKGGGGGDDGYRFTPGGRDPNAVAEYAQYLEKHDAEVTYCFMSKAWRYVCQEIFMLENIYRQTDPRYLKILGEIRVGKLSRESQELLLSRMLSNVHIPGHDPAETGFYLPEDYVALFPRKVDVEEYNQKRMVAIRNDQGWVYQSIDRCLNPKLAFLLNNFPVQEKIKIKVGTRVMLKKNMNFKHGLVNGRCGRVIGFAELFVEELGTKLFRPIEGCVIKQAVPVTTEKPVTPDYEVPEELRATLPAKLKKNSVCPSKIIATIPRNPDERDAKLGTKDRDLEDFEAISPQRAGLLRNSGFYPLPVVHWDNDELTVLTPQEWAVEEARKMSKKKRIEMGLDKPDGPNKSQAIVEKIKLVSRVQMPIIYAWAISIHMSQGLTIPKLCVDLGERLFEDGQAYVAASRGESLEGLVIRDLDFSKFNACPRVKAFYEVLTKKVGELRRKRQMAEQKMSGSSSKSDEIA